MKRPSPQVDQHGFPVPPKFGDDEPLNIKRRTLGGRRWSRLLMLGVLVAALVGLLFESTWGEGARWAWIQFLCDRALQEYSVGDLDSAVANLDRALTWAEADKALAPAQDANSAPPDDAAPTATALNHRKIAEIFRLRGGIKLEAHQVDAALEDAHHALTLARTSDGYLFRSMIWQRKHEFRKAIDDANQAVARGGARNAGALNARAYARAVANVELAEGLTDIENAIKFVGGDNSAFIDTRGYLHFLLGNNDAALKDLNQAIELMKKEQAVNLADLETRKVAKAAGDRQRRLYDENLAVMYHHRGEVYEKLGRSGEAQQDFELATKLGYNREQGVF